MTASALFSISSTLAMLGWVYLAVAARWTPRAFGVVRIGLPITLSAVYFVCLAFSVPDLQGGFDSIESVRLLFQNDWALAAGWVHYLAFDLFVGCWIIEISIQRRVSHWLVVPCLFATFMLGPIGYLMFRGAMASGKGAATSAA